MNPVLSDSEAYDEKPSISFTSLGLLVLDEIRLPGQEPLTDILGGSGAYASLGARLFLPTPLSRSLGWMMNIGNDFPELRQRYLESWGATMISFIYARIKANSSSAKDFMYTTSILQVDVSSLKSTPLSRSKAYHFLESPANIRSRASEILALRQGFGIPNPLIIWEPAPLSCKAENLQPCIEATGTVNVFSPNHLELARLFGEPLSTRFLDKEKIQSMALEFLNTNEGIGPDAKGFMIVRAGEEGCLVCARHIPPTWLPPFYRYGHDKVVDPTGAGNAFLGAFTIGDLLTEDAVQAACYGSIGASFALEQVGLPRLTRNEGASASAELWNGENVLERLSEYKRSIGGAEVLGHIDHITSTAQSIQDSRMLLEPPQRAKPAASSLHNAGYFMRDPHRLIVFVLVKHRLPKQQLLKSSGGLVIYINEELVIQETRSKIWADPEDHKTLIISSVAALTKNDRPLNNETPR
ncbi:pfkB family carbohydrate kinase superfamily [Aspergillus nidulans FGSC A4]|uniref:PfkB family carbohydrate kinase superfamily (AFU_orthologue AFUA_4G09500) n=1 Tax=Emericella nidulans (strain FGSC A4 / ATCC 38163 / CBS 112.46 / NRRL 194 / M139) TaxID=227321 RepID=C8VKU1_EMENI|nr:hypothetical protein [Aspergillus nidulans FGSC A4]CBF85826.1 TPA: pfkB family carbohydrate kinase superfamily (AFU_orthologue; AFUA_4G09500) [Aspergillus nidulans FGSC A4]